MLYAGSYMLLMSSRGQQGDRVELLSPIKTFVQPTKLTFYYHMLLGNASDKTASLVVFRVSPLLTYERQLFAATRSHGSQWQKTVLCLPVGVYRLALLGTVGNPGQSDLAVDNIQFNFDPTVCSELNTPPAQPGSTDYYRPYMCTRKHRELQI